MTKKPPPRPLPPGRTRPVRPARGRTRADVGPEPRLPEPRLPSPVAEPRRPPAEQSAVAAPPAPVEPAPVPPEPRDRKGRWAALAVVLVLGVVTLVGLHALGGQGDTSADPTAQRDPGTRPATRPPATRPPATLPAVGSFVESRIGADGRVHVVQWVRSGTPMRGLDLGLPTLAAASRSARAVDVRITADGRPVDGPGTVTVPGAHVALPDAATTVAIRYTLEGVVERSDSAPGRALVQATSLQVGYGDRRGPTRVQVVSPGVLSLACVSAASGVPQPCGSPGSGRWSVELRGDERADAVQAQVDLG